VLIGDVPLAHAVGGDAGVAVIEDDAEPAQDFLLMQVRHALFEYRGIHAGRAAAHNVGFVRVGFDGRV
jgi:hypothetical protein